VKQSSWHWLKQDRGAQVAEFAAVVPMLIMIIFGILWFGRAFNIYTTVNHAVRAAAEAAALHQCATCTASTADIEANVVNPILSASHLDPGLKQGFSITPVVISAATIPDAPDITGFNAQMSYPYNFKLNGVTCCPPALTPVTVGVTITAQAQAKEEN
jgi:Flp pilus assembly protein TadG